MRSQIEIWCNGSTTDFGSVCLGSNPGISTQKAGDIFIGFFVFANARRHFGNVDKTHSESWPPKPALHEPSAPNHPAPKLQAKRSKRETIRNDMRSFQGKNFAQFQPHSEQNSHIIRSHREHRHPGTTPESTRLSI